MKTTKWKSVALMGMLVAVTSGCATDEEMSDKAIGSNGKQMTIMVGTESGSNTRVSYDEDQDDTPWLTWELGDKLFVDGFEGGVFVESKVYLLNAEDHGKTIGAFTGDEIVGADRYHVFYPRKGGLSIVEQTQVGDKSTAHLKDNIYLETYYATDLSNISLSMQTCILKFVLSGIPKEVGTLKQLKWVIDTPSSEQTHTLNFSTAPADKIQFSDTKDDLTAYLAFSHVATMIKQGGKFRVELVGDNIYHAETTLDAKKYYEPGHWYTVLIDGQPSTMEWKP